SDLGDVQAHIVDAHVEERGGLLAQLLDVLALLADDDARARGLDGDVHLLRGALDEDAADGSFLEPLLEKLAYAEISMHVHRELLLAGVPAAGPVAGNAEPYAERVDFLAHALILLAVAHADGDVTVALDDARAASLGARSEALELRGRIHVDERHLQLVDVGTVVVLRIGHCGLEHLAHEARALLGHELQRRDGVADALAAHHIGPQPALLRRDACVTELRSHLHVLSPGALRWPLRPYGRRSAP